MALRLPFLLILLLILSGCESLPDRKPYVPPPRPDVLEKVRQLLGAGQALEAAVMLKNLGPQGPAELGLQKEILAALDALEVQLEGEDNPMALANLTEDRITLGLPHRDRRASAEAVREQYRKLGWGAPLIIKTQELLEGLSGKDRMLAARVLRDEGAYHAFARAVTGLEALLDDQDREFLKKAPTPATYMGGTVTVIVNKGLKVEMGIGSPDIVIGSGFFIDRRGYLLTNYHVIQSEVDPEYEGYSRLFISLPNSKGERIPAKVVGWDSNLDVALLKVEVTPAYVFSFADRPEINLGDRLFAIGSPGGLESTITSGIVSATGRKFLPMGDAIQVDAAVNPGNSGGPLIDESGWVVGLVFAGIPQFQGVNFAVSGAYIRKLIPWLYQGGEVRHLWLGLGARETWAGMEIDFVATEGPAARQGLSPGRILQSLQGVDLSASPDLHLPLLDLRRVVHTTWKTEDGIQELYLFRTPRPPQPLKTAFEAQPPEDLIPHLFGIDLEIQGHPSSRWFKVVKVVSGSSGDLLGLSPGDPVQLKSWEVIKESETVAAQLFMKRRLGGYFESTVGLQALLQSPRIF